MALDAESWDQGSYEMTHVVDDDYCAVCIGCNLPSNPDDADLPKLNYRRVKVHVEVAIVVATAATSYHVISV